MPTQRATGQIQLHCRRGRRGFWVKLSLFEWITNLLWTRDPLDLVPDPTWTSVSYAVGGVISRHPMLPTWGTNIITVEAGDHMLNVWCETGLNPEPLHLPIRVVPGQTVNVYYNAPQAKSRPATLGFTPS
ncbi:hypothetical protein AXK60_16475 [Tsukamurella pseudospumae]|uniref:Uncharacterized protein n=2 Tax=Tsukamurella pseudospumae TaxID=239498 RepID=A0A137ZYZ2_9ACTN|nr:hypothetical protein AXK61_20480 [Tsukamurella pseudospumae]KXP03421.1 hypothetical protein AXK60_16475 [Tsukamurella pseudospumae]